MVRGDWGDFNKKPLRHPPIALLFANEIFYNLHRYITFKINSAK